MIIFFLSVAKLAPKQKDYIYIFLSKDLFSIKITKLAMQVTYKTRDLGKKEKKNL